MDTRIAIIGMVIALAIGFALGSSYQNDSPSKENTERINAMYSIVYISDIESETIGVNIVSADKPGRKCLQNIVFLNKYDILEYIGDGDDRMFTFAFKGYSSEGKPIIEVIKGFQKELDYKEDIYKVHGYYPVKIIRSD